MNAVFTDSAEPLNLDHLAFGFETKNQKNILNFTFSSLNKNGELVEFNSTIVP